MKQILDSVTQTSFLRQGGSRFLAKIGGGQSAVMSSTGMFLTASGGSLRGGSQEAVSSDKLYRDVIDCPRRQSEGGQSITTTSI